MSVGDSPTYIDFIIAPIPLDTVLPEAVLLPPPDFDASSREAWPSIPQEHHLAERKQKTQTIPAECAGSMPRWLEFEVEYLNDAASPFAHSRTTVAFADPFWVPALVLTNYIDFWTQRVALPDASFHSRREAVTIVDPPLTTTFPHSALGGDRCTRPDDDDQAIKFPADRDSSISSCPSANNFSTYWRGNDVWRWESTCP
jgi:hypothetical protein